MLKEKVAVQSKLKITTTITPMLHMTVEPNRKTDVLDFEVKVPGLINGTARVTLDHTRKRVDFNKLNFNCEDKRNVADLLALAHGRIVQEILKQKPEAAPYLIDRNSINTIENSNYHHANALGIDSQNLLAYNKHSFSEYHANVMTALNARGFKFKKTPTKRLNYVVNAVIHSTHKHNDVPLSRGSIPPQKHQAHLIEFEVDGQKTGYAYVHVYPKIKRVEIGTFYPHNENISIARQGVGSQAMHKVITKLLSEKKLSKDYKLLIIPTVSRYFRGMLRASKLGKAVYDGRGDIKKQGVSVSEWINRSKRLMEIRNPHLKEVK